MEDFERDRCFATGIKQFDRRGQLLGERSTQSTTRNDSHTAIAQFSTYHGGI